MLTNGKCGHKIGTIQNRALRFLLNHYESYQEELLKRSRKTSMNLRRHYAYKFYSFINL